MGICLVTAYWDPSSDKLYTALLRSAAVEQGISVDVDPNMVSFRQGKMHFSAEISGISIPWNGGVNSCQQILRNLGEKWKTQLENHGAKGVSIYVHHHPM